MTDVFIFSENVFTFIISIEKMKMEVVIQIRLKSK